MFSKCKITVVRRGLDKELVDAYLASPGKFGRCNKVKENQEYIVENPFEKPVGMCSSAWADIRSNILALASGSRFPFMKDKNSILASCSDLFRPVIYRIERIDGADRNDGVDPG